MSDGIAETAQDVAQTIANEARELVADHNATTQEAREVADALLAAGAENIHLQEMRTLRDEIFTRCDAVAAESRTTREELELCRMTIQGLTDQMLTLAASSPPVLIPIPSPSPSVEEVAPLEPASQVNPDDLEPPAPQSPPEPRKPKRRLI